MTDAYIESSCGLTNGVRFEELIVDTFYADGKPKIYKVVCSYSANPYANGPADKVKDRIYFDGKAGTWWTDTSTNGLYCNYGNSRKLFNKAKETPTTDSSTEKIIYVSRDSIVRMGPKPDLSEYESRRQITSPVKFKSGTWYYIDLHDYHIAYLYVDKNMNYNISTINTATNY
ncbi:MAG: hypothetical protein ABIR78_08320 [Ferruginibacter sp.]